MAVDPRKRQKQQQRRAAKRKSKQHLMVKEKQAGMPERLAAAARYPILHCLVTRSLWSQGIGWLCLSRELPNGSVAFAMFLIDRYCLGVKNVIMNVTGRFTYDSDVVRKIPPPTQDMQPAAARKLLESAVAYARSLGLHPHADYSRAMRIFGDIDAAQCTETFEFGKDGKPLFIAGPNDTLERCHRIVKALNQACGPDGHHYMIPVSGTDDVHVLAGDETDISGNEDGDLLEEERENGEDRLPIGHAEQ